MMNSAVERFALGARPTPAFIDEMRRLYPTEPEIDALFVRKLAKLLAVEISPQLVEQLIKRVDSRPPKRFILERRIACALLLGLSDVAVFIFALCHV